jgi:shikimate kinase
MNWMKKEGVVIWLDESIEVLVSRLTAQKAQRPLIANLDDNEIEKFIQEKLVERNPIYQQANYRLTSDEIKEANLKKLILKHVS